MLNKTVQTAGLAKSFEGAAQLLALNAEMAITGRYVGELAEKIGKELYLRRDQRTEDYVHHRRATPSGAVPLKAAVSVDGGRVHTRAVGQGPGVHEPAWREDKVGCLQILDGPTFAEDPHPEPPKCFLDRAHVTQLVKDFQQHKGLRAYDDADPGEVLPAETLPAEAVVLPAPALSGVEPGLRGVAPPQASDSTPTAATLLTVSEPAPTTAADGAAKRQWPPRRQERTCVASLASSREFGKMLAAEAYQRNFFQAGQRAFLGDGLAYNWTIQQKWFSTFVAILDFIHPLSYIYAAAGVGSSTEEERWQKYVRWMSGCWQGRVAAVLVELRQEQATLAERRGEPPKAEGTTGGAEVLRKTIGYLENNQERMNYPEYRKKGLPVTSVAVESLIKEFNYRVKGTEKFWNRPEKAEAILQIRAGVLSHDNRLERYILERPGSPYRRPRETPTRQTTHSR